MKKFELEHWYEMLNDQPKWRAICDHLSQGQDGQKGPNLTPKRLEMKVSMGMKDPRAEKPQRGG